MEVKIKKNQNSKYLISNKKLNIINISLFEINNKKFQLKIRIYKKFLS
jgi:hypothetical protein